MRSRGSVTDTFTLSTFTSIRYPILMSVGAHAFHICCLMQDGTRRRGRKYKSSNNQAASQPALTQQQTFELEPLMRTDSSSSTTSVDELTSPTSPTHQQPPTLPLLLFSHQRLQPLLSTRLQSALLPHLPPILSHVPQWYLVYSTSLHGHSLSTLYQRSSVHPAAVSDGALLVCRDSDGWVFGCWTSERWERRDLYYGGSESFVFTWQPNFQVYEAREETRRRQSRERRQRREARHTEEEQTADEQRHDDEQEEEADDEDEEREVGMSGAGYYQLAKIDQLAIGGGERFALWLDSAFRDGTSGPCSTFDSPTLSKRPQFKCYELEVWGM